MKKLLSIFIFLSLVPFAMAQTKDSASNMPDNMTISIFNEAKNQGNTGILIGDEQKIKSIYPTGSFDLDVNVVFVRTATDNILIDTGFGNNIADNLKKLGLTPADVDVILLTHMHGDHIGGLLKNGKAVFPKARVYLSAPERAHWENEELPKQIFSVYGNRVQTFTPNELGSSMKELIKGVSPIAAYGHTPGHTIYMLESGGKKFIVWGDTTHATAVQLAFPEISIQFDSDPEKAAQTRIALFKYLAENNIPVAGMHLAAQPSTMQLMKNGAYMLTVVK